MSRHRSEPPGRVLAGVDVVLTGLFSAKDKGGLRATLEALVASVEAHGGRVVGQHVQRRGVSHGGVSKMTSPYSRRTLISAGKVREVAEACRTSQAGAVVFANPLTEHQRSVLNEMFDCPVLSSDDLLPRR